MQTSIPQLDRVASLGAGATSTVDLARLTEPWAGLPAGTEVAVKRLREDLRDDPSAVEGLRREATVSEGLRHESLVRVLGEGVDSEGPFLVLAYVPGRTLAERLEADGPLPEPLLRRVGAQLAGALEVLHDQSLVHGDIKPENVRIDAEGRAVLLDLGLARAAHGDEGPVGGSLPYLAPERARGLSAGTASDVFSLGVVLYELATGAHPFDPDAGGLQVGPLRHSSGRVLRRAIQEQGADVLLAALAISRVEAPSSLAPQLTPLLDSILLAALERDPVRRPTAAELGEVLQEGEVGSWWRLRARSEPAPRADLHDTPLIGRDRELDALAALLSEVQRSDHGALAWITGPQGSGKWRLVREFVERARQGSQPPIYLYARWTQQAEARPAGAMLVLLNRWLQLPPGQSVDARGRAQLESLVTPETATELLAAVDPDREASSPGSVGRALAEWLTAVSSREPVVVFLDDLHRAGEVTLAALSELVDRLGAARVLLVLGSREEPGPGAPEESKDLAALVRRAGAGGSVVLVSRIELGALTEEDVAEIVKQVFHRSSPRLRLAEVLWERSRGNPGLVAEILRELRARGVTQVADDGKLRLALEPEDLPMPASLQTLIADRLREVSPQLRRWLERLAVIGGRIEPDFVLTAFPPTGRKEVDDLLAELVRGGWLVPAGSRYRFARPALREAIYRGMTPGRRRRLHAAAARGLAGSHADVAPTEELFQRAFHLRAAEEHAQALALVLHLLERLRSTASAQRLSVLARWGLEALDHVEASADRATQGLVLLEVAADAADRLGAREEERELLDRLVDLGVDSETDPSLAARLYLLHGRYALGTGQFGLARGFLRNAKQLADDAQSQALQSEARRRLAGVQAQIGELQEARLLANEALDQAETPQSVALSHLTLATIDALEDSFEDGLERVARAVGGLRRARRPDLGVLGFASLLRARLLRSAGRSARALGAARRAVRLAQRAGERPFAAEARARLGALLFDLDRDEEAETQLREALLSAREIEDRRGQVIAETWLGILLWEADDPGARGVIQRAADSAHDIGFYRAEAVALAILARIHFAQGDLEAAERDSRLSADRVELYGAELADRIVCLGTRALVLDARGEQQRAREVVRRLRRRMRRENSRIRSGELRRGQRSYSTRLLELVLSPSGPVYPRGAS